jgi:hypothetical protein
MVHNSKGEMMTRSSMKSIQLELGSMSSSLQLRVRSSSKFDMVMPQILVRMIHWMPHKSKDQHLVLRSSWSIRLVWVHNSSILRWMVRNSSTQRMVMVQILVHSCQLMIRNSTIRSLVLHRNQSMRQRMASMIGNSGSVHSMCSIQRREMARKQRSTAQLRTRSSRGLIGVHSSNRSRILWLVRMEHMRKLILRSSSIEHMVMGMVQHSILQWMVRRHKGSLMAHSSSLSIQLQLVRMKSTGQLVRCRRSRLRGERVQWQRSIGKLKVHSSKPRLMVLRSIQSIELELARKLSRLRCTRSRYSNQHMETMILKLKRFQCMCLWMVHRSIVQLMKMVRSSSWSKQLGMVRMQHMIE